MNNSPAFQFYAADYLADENVQLMSLEDEGCYIRLLAYCWREGSIPADPEKLARLCKGVTPSETVISCFKGSSSTLQNSVRLVHPRLEEERRKQDDWKRKCAKGGKRSAGKRKQIIDKTPEQGSSTTLGRVVQVKANSSSSSSSSNNSTLKSAARSRGSRFVPTDFEITDTLREWAVKERPDLDLNGEIDRFRDHEFPRAYTDWSRTFKNWIRGAKGRPVQPTLKPTPDTVGRPPDAVEIETLEHLISQSADELSPEQQQILTHLLKKYPERKTA